VIRGPSRFCYACAGAPAPPASTVARGQDPGYPPGKARSVLQDCHFPGRGQGQDPGTKRIEGGSSKQSCAIGPTVPRGAFITVKDGIGSQRKATIPARGSTQLLDIEPGHCVRSPAIAAPQAQALRLVGAVPSPGRRPGRAAGASTARPLDTTFASVNDDRKSQVPGALRA
jgi:hypothetical protein